MERIVLNHRRNRRSIEDRRETGVKDGESRAHSKRCLIALGHAQRGVLQRLHRALVQRQLCACRPQAQPHQGQAAAKRGQGLAEDRILLPLELGQKSRKRLRVGLIDATAGDQLIDQVLNVLSRRALPVHRQEC